MVQGKDMYILCSSAKGFTMWHFMIRSFNSLYLLPVDVFKFQVMNLNLKLYMSSYQLYEQENKVQ